MTARMRNTSIPCNSIKHAIALFAICAMPGLGCAGAKAYRQGKEAEKRGEAHIAYAYYAKAAQSNPDDRDYTRSIRRLGPTAAKFWFDHAKLAEADDRPIDAWKACMRCIMIEPDHREALTYIADLETKHRRTLTPIKRDWQTKGASILAIRVPATPPDTAKAPAPAAKLSYTGTAASQRKSARSKKIPSSRADAIAKTRKPKSSSKNVKPRPSATAQIATNRNKQPAPASKNSFILSKDDDRYGDRIKAIDDLIVELRKTNDKLEADIDLYDGKRRIQKIRGLKAGRSKLLLAPANRWFRLSLERVDDESETIAFRLDPA